MKESAMGRRYWGLVDYLNEQDGDLTLKFDEIEKIIDRPLPKTAYVSQGWWPISKKMKYEEHKILRFKN